MPFAPLQNDTFLRACLGQATDYTPIWLMRQAGALFARVPGHARTRGQLHGASDERGLRDRRDAAALGSLRAGCGDFVFGHSDRARRHGVWGLHFVNGEGPRFERAVRTEADVAALAVPDMERLRYVFDAVTSIRRALGGRVPLIGFSGSPWDAGVLHGRRGRVGRLPPRQAHALQPTGSDTPAVGSQRRLGGALFAPADRGWGAGGDGVRQLGWGVGRRGVPHLQPRLYPPRSRTTATRARGPGDSAHRLHQGGAGSAGSDGRAGL
jgi:hypothetical protein